MLEAGDFILKSRVGLRQFDVFLRQVGLIIKGNALALFIARERLFVCAASDAEENEVVCYRLKLNHFAAFKHGGQVNEVSRGAEAVLTPFGHLGGQESALIAVMT